MRAVGEIVGGGRTISGTNLGVSQQLLGEAMRIGNLARRLTGEIGETIGTHGGTDTVGGRNLPVRTRPDAEAFMGIRPSQAVRGGVKLLKTRALIRKA